MDILVISIIGLIIITGMIIVDVRTRAKPEYDSLYNYIGAVVVDVSTLNQKVTLRMYVKDKYIIKTIKVPQAECYGLHLDDVIQKPQC